MPIPLSEQQYVLDLWIPPSGAFGYAALIQPALVNSQAVTVDQTTDILTFATTPYLAQGQRIRLGGTLPTVTGVALSTGTDYFYRPTSGVSGLTGKLYRTLLDAQNDTNNIDFTSAGTSVTVTEQLFNGTDPLSVIVNREVGTNGAALNGYARKLVTSVGNALINNNRAEKPPVVWTQAASSAGSIIYRQVLMIRSGVATVGDSTGSFAALQSESGTTTISANSSRNIPLTFIMPSFD